MTDCGLIIAFYQTRASAEQSLIQLKKHGFSKVCLVYPGSRSGLIEGWKSSFRYRLFGTGVEQLRRYEALLLQHETLMLVEGRGPDLREILNLMRRSGKQDSVAFVLLPHYPEERDYTRTFLPRKPLTNEGLTRHAKSLAKKYAVADVQTSHGKSLLKRLENCAQGFGKIYENLQQSLHLDQSTTLSCEWLLDNSYVIQAHIEDIRRNLPKWFYRELPQIVRGSLQGLPRAYGLAVELVAATDGRIDRENIKLFLEKYQTITPLAMGELWAFPLLLRLRLIECLELLAIRVLNRQRESQEADLWSNRLLNAVRRYPEKLYYFLGELSKDKPYPTSHFADQMIDHLSDEKEALVPVRAWLSHKLGEEISQIIQNEKHQQVTEQISLSNAITSLLRLSQLDWREIFEETSIVDKIFAQEVSGTYWLMDFDTRDLYRHSLEKLSRWIKTPETTLASQVVEMTRNGANDLERHLGYYLIDKGRKQLEKATGCIPPLLEKMKGWVLKHVSTFFFLSFAFLTILILMLGMPLWWLALIPATEIAVQVVIYLFTALSAPTILPKMFYKQGVPNHCRTIVVVPMMLTDPASIRKEIEKLEIRYLGNSDPNLRFALLSDFLDAPQKEMPEDKENLEAAMQGIQSLNEKHGTSQFFLFHRERQWNPSEECWMGWERKRGKIEILNRFLLGDTDPETENLLYVGDPSQLQGITYVITLDSDTQLFRNRARHLIETLSHPLNRPYYSREKGIERGYTIIQPRVSTALLSQTATYFAEFFADPSGTDPYNWAVSDLYQDLFNEGIYHGKGIYDLRAFHALLDRRMPDNIVLSHDLLEGAYVGTGFASDIELYDQFPSNYFGYIKRLHRWIRGDWQISGWLFPKVPVKDHERQVNPLSFINRWKIFDNLRRSLVYPTLVLFLLATWYLGSSAGSWLALVLLAAPAFLPPTWEGIKKNALRGILNAALLPYQAYLNLDAIFKALFRCHFSRRQVLEWDVSTRRRERNPLLTMSWIPFFAAIVFGVLFWKSSSALLAALPFLVLWGVSPFIVKKLNQAQKPKIKKELKAKDIQFLKNVARMTWRYFDDFVMEKMNWLPPDNYQHMLRIELANRTSSTNIGMYLLSAVSATAFGYLSVDEFLDRIHKALDSIKKLELYEGHLLNWYNIETLQPLHPRYVSTVDSGNLIACLWALEHALNRSTGMPIIDQRAFSGLKDTLNVLAHLIKKLTPTGRDHISAFSMLFALFSRPSYSLGDSLEAIESAMQLSKQLEEKLQQNFPLSEEEGYWMQKFQSQLMNWQQLLETYFGWIKAAVSFPELADAVRSVHDAEAPSLEQLANGTIPGMAAILDIISKNPQAELLKLINGAREAAAAKLNSAADGARYAKELSDGMKMDFLYNPERKLFSIGYNVSDQRLDNSYYDLFASEARIASYVSIALGHIPVEHWWNLGRPFGPCFGRTVLQSWGGTMFEYLMPLMLMRSFDHTLLNKAYDDAVACQIDYGRLRKIPWGISESAYSGLDYHKIYQYRAFGVPGLGLKRGLEEDLVVTPYSSALALMVDPHEAVSNLRILDEKAGMLGSYGFYEAIDYTREHDPEGKKGVIIYAYMAHHVGMSLISITNVLQKEILQRLFHADPRVMASESLLYERISIPETHTDVHFKEPPLPKAIPFVPEVELRTSNPNTPIPQVQLLSNGNYSVMVSNSGTGYSKWEDLDVSRWRVDSTSDRYGHFFYIKDVEKDVYWTSTFMPNCTQPAMYEVNFKTDKAEFRRRDFGIETLTEIVVSPEDQAEIRCLTLANLSMRTRTLEITSYEELALATHVADRAHPAFSKMFIQTEVNTELGGLLAFRRQRSPEDPVYWAVHVMAQDTPAYPLVQYETGRAKFIGRGRETSNPLAMHGPLSNSVGCVLDPIFSLRQKIILDPGKRVKISFVTAMAKCKKDALGLMQKYYDFRASQRGMEMAWAQAELDLRYLHITHDKVQQYQQLASRIIYPHAHLRASADNIRRNTLGQRSLWAYGISGDLPIIVATVGNSSELDVIKEFITAHTFLRMKGLKCDLVIFNTEPSSYDQPLQDQLQKLIQAYSHLTGINKPGGAFLLSLDKLPPEEITLIYAAAHVVLHASRGTLRQQLAFPIPAASLPQPFKAKPSFREEPSPTLPFLELLFFNGIGGFTADHKEYAIFLADKIPANPWVNIIANHKFGVMASARGSMTTWNANSQSNRLTPWSNDPIINPTNDTLYLRNEDSGVYWTLTPSPIKELDPYRTRHGQGYTFYEHNSHAIEQELLVFVPLGDEYNGSVRIQKLRVWNKSSHRYRLSATTYAELVLGTNKEETQMHIVTSWNSECQALFATNVYHTNFGGYVAFSASLPLPASFTADRTEFIGRNGTLSSPAALHRTTLSGKCGAGLDPCAALQVVFDLDTDEQIETLFLFGQAPSIQEARDIIFHYRDHLVVETAFTATREWWDKKLTTIQIDTPDLATNILFNRWLLYQNLSCRVWARTGFYQSSGAYGFRDQLQDVSALFYSYPQLAREQILRAASRQFTDGDVQHWWHPQSGEGVRTRISDDLLWLPYVTANYVRITGDADILKEEIFFLDGKPLAEDEHEVLSIPTVSKESAPLLEHCCRAIHKSLAFGVHGLPLIGGGDWNDGFNWVGHEGKGESVWLAWFMIVVMRGMIPLVPQETAQKYQEQIKILASNIEQNAWDGEWYIRAFYDDGQPLGSKVCEEARIDSIAQSWAVLSEAAEPQRVELALRSVKEQLVHAEEKMVLLFTPPFDHCGQEPGYIKAYPPGVRENGGQYTHAALWYASALAHDGQGDEAVKILKMLNPINHALNEAELIKYRTEPYIVAADVYSLEGHIGEGGWTWYTGSAGVMYRVWLEDILGFKLQGNQLAINPTIPSDWPYLTIHYHYRNTWYEIHVENPNRKCRGVERVELDGQELPDKIIPLAEDGGRHRVRILL